MFEISIYPSCSVRQWIGTDLGQLVRADVRIVLDQCKQVIREKLGLGIRPVNDAAAGDEDDEGGEAKESVSVVNQKNKCGFPKAIWIGGPSRLNLKGGLTER